MTKLETARRIVAQRNCFGVTCSNCPAASEDNNTSGTYCVVGGARSSAAVQYFVKYIHEHEHEHGGVSSLFVGDMPLKAFAEEFEYFREVAPPGRALFKTYASFVAPPPMSASHTVSSTFESSTAARRCRLLHEL